MPGSCPKISFRGSLSSIPRKSRPFTSLLLYAEELATLASAPGGAEGSTVVATTAEAASLR